MNYRRWFNVLEKSPLEKLPTVVECFAKMNECFREIIPTGVVPADPVLGPILVTFS